MTKRVVYNAPRQLVRVWGTHTYRHGKEYIKFRSHEEVLAYAKQHNLAIFNGFFRGRYT